MENSITEVEAQQSFRSPPRRRRSTFFERRESIMPQTLKENVNVNKSEVMERHPEYEYMARYYEKLLTEKELWKQELRERKHKYHDLKQQFELAVKASSKSRMSYTALSNEDINFLKEKPSISKLVDSQQKLHTSVMETTFLVRRANELDNIVLSHSEDIVKKITDYILDNSSIESVD